MARPVGKDENENENEVRLSGLGGIRKEGKIIL